MSSDPREAWPTQLTRTTELGEDFCASITAAPVPVEHLVARTAIRMMLEDRHSLQAGLGGGLGAVNLTITEEQYRKLLR
jgi:hypothetical protein